MFTTLLESKPKRDKNPGGAIASVVLHAGLIGLAVAVTLNAGLRSAKEHRQEDVKFVQTKAPPPKPEPPKPPPPQTTVAPPPPKGFQVLTAPINIPTKIPDVDLSKAVTNEADFSGKGVEGGVAKGVAGGKGPVNPDQTYFEFQVEKPALAKEDNPRPTYPSMLESAGVEGEVLVQFVIDTLGRADMNTFKVLKSSNDLFTQSIKNVLPRLRFYAAETGGRKVRELVQYPFSFAKPK
ncbi:MAG: energy transducer TonB [Gemmatimonadaceae bacterium]